MRYTNISYKIFTIANIIVLTLFGIVALFPYLNVLALALNDGNDSTLGSITIFPRVVTLANFKAVLSDDNIANSIYISVSRVILGVSSALTVQFFAAYAFTRKSLPGRKALLLFLTVPMFITGGLIPQYILYSKIGLLNNFLVYILPSAFSFYNMIIIRTYLNTIPSSLREAARIDGASEFTILFKIIIPLAVPILVTISLWLAVSHWNDWTTTLYFISQKKYYTLQYILMQIIKEGERIAQMIIEAQQDGNTIESGMRATPDSLKAAQVIITTIPIILIYPFLQKYFVKGVMIGSVKE